jgi:hypothetical protein
MDGEKENASLVEEYRMLRQIALHGGASDLSSAETERRLDAIYARIVAIPVVDIRAALEKLWFAHHCLTEEDDFKEATNLIHQVCLALEVLARKVRNGASVV